MNLPALLSFLCGFSSLSIEILWVRSYGFAQTSTPRAFGFVLMSYLIGVALGAHYGGKLCRKGASDTCLWTSSVAALLLSGALTMVLPALFAVMTSSGIDDPLSAIFVIALQSCVLAFVFPIAHHLGVQRRLDEQGQRFAKVYTANVAGAALGPLATGYMLLDWLTLQQSFVSLALFQWAAATIVAVMVTEMAFRRAIVLVVPATMVAVGVLSARLDPHELIQHLNEGGKRAETIIENRQGVITIFSTKEGDDAVYGGNLYDGRTNLDMERNTNGLERTILLSVLQPQPKRVLVLGLSIGTWLALVNEFPGVEQVDVVEINPGYIQAANDYPLQANALRDPRVRVHIDDARRWLRYNSDSKYDLIVMNTTWHWRANSSLLLSTEFLSLVKAHMAQGAVIAYNTTSSADAFFTASKVFTHAYRYKNFVYAAEFDFRGRKNAPGAAQSLSKLQLDGKPMFSAGSTKPDIFLSIPFETVDQIQKRTGRPLEQITDQNMITEFKYGRRLY